MIGIAITTHNRSQVLAYTLRHFDAFHPLESYILVVTDDASKPEEAAANARICAHYGVHYSLSPERLGIAKNKNRGIHYLRGFDVSDYFLFDDDCMPRERYWDQPFIRLQKDAGIHHSMHLVQAGPDVAVVNDNGTYRIWSNAGGFCMYFSRLAMNELRGMDERFGIYGHEHAELSRRACQKGWTPAGAPYISPSNAGEFIYSLDMDLGWHQEVSPLGEFTEVFTSSVEDERPLIAGYIAHAEKTLAEIAKEK
jgi:GT2 family glycosyltransferase